MVLAFTAVADGPSAVTASKHVPLDVPESVSRWFTENGVAKVPAFVEENFSDEEKPAGDLVVTIGVPVPNVIPFDYAYDLAKKRVVGSTQIRRGDLVAHSYCAVATVEESSTGVLECAALDPDGRVIESSAGTLDEPARADVTDGLDAVAEYHGVGAVGFDLEAQTFVLPQVPHDQAR